MESTQNSIESRRRFLKKAAYVAPAIIVLGSLAAPQSANASYIHVAQVNNFKSNRTAELYQENDGTKWVKSVEADAHVTETLVHKTKPTFLSWLNSFFA